MKPLYFLFAATAFLLCACGGNTGKQAADEVCTETDVDYIGVYRGVLPAAGCPGARMRLSLGADSLYTLRLKYIDRTPIYRERGRYTVEGDLLTLIPDKEVGQIYYRIEEGHLRTLNADKQPYRGRMAEHYVLDKEKSRK